MKKATVLVVDDDRSLQTVVRQYLEDDGYRVLAAHSGAEIEAAMDKQPDAVLLDLVLPDADGFSLIARIRGLAKIPIIIVSGKSDTTEKIVGLEMGADDYMTKPFEMRELAARLRAVLRRAVDAPPAANAASAPANSVISFGGWRFDRLQYQLFDAEGRSAGLTAGEFRLLEALVLSPNRVLTRDYLFELTRDGEFESSDRAVDIQIGRIRKKINDNSRAGDIIKTVRGVGYMFCAPSGEGN